MIEIRNVMLLTRKEIRDAIRNRWPILYTVVFAAMAWSLSWMGLAAIQEYGISSFGRTSVSLINLVLLVVPLMGIFVGALSLAFEREKGTLAYTLSQPVTHAEVLSGKYLGIAASLLAALLLGFGISGGLVGWKSGMHQVGAYVSLLGLSFLLALISLMAAVPTADGTGTPRRFDDIGCLVAFVKTSAVPPPTIWVHAYEGDAWIRAPDASVVVNDQIHTAMGSGIVAVDSLPAAERLASNGKGELVTIDELISGTPDEQ